MKIVVDDKIPYIRENSTGGLSRCVIHIIYMILKKVIHMAVLRLRLNYLINSTNIATMEIQE